MMIEKDILWEGSSLQDLRTFPEKAKKEAGFQLAKVQVGQEPSDWKPFKTIGSGVSEIRIKDEDGAYRVLYVAKFEEAIYVLHCFQKKTEKTSKQDKEVARVRYCAVIDKRNRNK